MLPRDLCIAYCESQIYCREACSDHFFTFDAGYEVGGEMARELQGDNITVE